jgi:hypothetical protein
MTQRQVGLKLDPELHDLAVTVATASKESFKDFVSIAVKRELDRRLSGASGKKLRTALDALRDYQADIEESQKSA